MARQLGSSDYMQLVIDWGRGQSRRFHHPDQADFDVLHAGVDGVDTSTNVSVFIYVECIGQFCLNRLQAAQDTTTSKADGVDSRNRSNEPGNVLYFFFNAGNAGKYA